MVTLVLEIEWLNGTERIRLDLDAIAKTKTLRTEEFWHDADLPVVYHPRCGYRVGARGDHILTLTYLPEEHQAIPRDAVVWGTSVLVIDRSLRKASATWTTTPTDTESDGEASVSVTPEPCLNERERQSITRAKRVQEAFKKALLKRVKTCELLGESTLTALEAVHVQDVWDGGPDVPENGLLLRADLHRLFDARLIALNSNGTVLLSPLLSERYQNLLRGRRLSVASLSRIRPFLAKRRQRSALGIEGV